MVDCDLIKFGSVEEMIESRAQESHLNNLRYGGVFDEEGNRVSDIERERAWVRKNLLWVSGSMAKALIGVSTKSPSVYYYKNFGYAESEVMDPKVFRKTDKKYDHLDLFI